MHWVFETLGIDAEADAGAIRRAYARAIKQCDQVAEAARFQRIREAYEMAMQWAAQDPTVAPLRSSPGDAVSMQDVAPASVSFRGGDVEEIAQSAKGSPHPQDLWSEFLAAYRQARSGDVQCLLNAYASDARLIALDAKADFECSLLTLAFAAPANINLLDAASDLFSWETANRHLAEARPDLMHRLQRQQLLRHTLTRRHGGDMKDFMEAVSLHAARDNPAMRPAPWKITYINDAFDRYAAFRRELAERFGADVIEWWACLLRREEGSKAPKDQAIYLGNQPYVEWNSGRANANPATAHAGNASSASKAIGRQTVRSVVSALRLSAEVFYILFAIAFFVLVGIIVIALLLKFAVRMGEH